MQKHFTLGMVAGMSALVLAVPLVAQVSSAASTGSDAGPMGFFQKERPPLTTETIQAMVDGDAAVLAHIDELTAAFKAATQTKKDALTAALSLPNDAARQTAVQTAMETFHAAMKTAMDAAGVQPPFGPGFGPHLGMGKGGHHRFHHMDDGDDDKETQDDAAESSREAQQ